MDRVPAIIGTTGSGPNSAILSITTGSEALWRRATAVSMPLRREGMSRPRFFWYGQLSAVVEPIAAVIGAGAVILAEPLLPYALGFAAGAMICFAVMMVLDVAFG